MTRHGISAEQAFQQLSHESQNTNIKLRDIAARLVQDLGPAAE